MGTSRLRVLLAAALSLAACASTPPSTRGGAPLRLMAADRTTQTLDELRQGGDATVLVFWSDSCPCVRRYQERVDSLLDAWPAGRLRVLGVSSNAGETFEGVLAAAAERKVRIPIFRDEGGAVAQALGADSTPTVVLLDASGAIRFRGWLDNERLPGQPGREPWLERAIKGVLDGSTSFPSRSPTYGCTITRSLFSAPCCSIHPPEGIRP